MFCIVIIVFESVLDGLCELGVGYYKGDDMSICLGVLGGWWGVVVCVVHWCLWREMGYTEPG